MVLSRLKKLQEEMEKKGCGAFLVEDKINLFYFTGLELSNGLFIATNAGGVLLVDHRYFERAKTLCPYPVELSDSTSPKELLQTVETVGVDGTVLTHQKFKDFEQLLSGKKLLSFPGILRFLRRVKDPHEIAALRKAAQIGNLGFDLLQSLFKEGISEIELAQELEIHWKKLGSKGVAFEPIIAFGANSSMPHYRASKTHLRPGEHILIDIGVNYEHYNSDKTRVFFFGPQNQQIEEIYKIVQEAQKEAIQLCKPGALIGEIDRAARKVIKDAGYGDKFVHSLGHGVGLEIHEEPFLRNKPGTSQVPLEEGMVITIEPGIYLQGIGGVRYEDTLLITAKSCEVLTAS